MGNKDFYSDRSYRKKQQALTKLNWKNGRFKHLIRRSDRVCGRSGCENTFTAKPSDPKIYCSRKCSALVTNIGRVKSSETKAKIGRALKGKHYPERQGITTVDIICQNPQCGKTFQAPPWKDAKYCSNLCVMTVVGSRPTSPRAARAKAGIRPDIDPDIYFYSRWEANYARILDLQKIPWVHQPKRFKLHSQYYTPDFYLPKTNTYVEIKNFLSDYSLKRDTGFRELYPKEKLILILKDDYKKLEEEYSGLIPNWEFS